MYGERMLSFTASSSLFLGALALLVFIAAAESAERSPGLQRVIEGANKEGNLAIEWLGGRIGDHQGVNAIVKAVNKRYGTNIRVSFTPGPNYPQMLHKLTQEWRAGVPSSSDIYLGTANHIINGLNSGMLKKLDWRATLERPVPPGADIDRVAPKGAGVAIASGVVGITYNTRLVTGNDIPKSVEDVFKTKWKGRIASTPFATGLYQFASPDVLGYEYMKNYTQRLAKQIGGLLTCADVDRIASGEFAMLVFDCGHFDALRFQRRGAPVGHAVVHEVARININYFAIPEHARNPNAGTLFVNFAHTEEGQKLLWEYAAYDLHIYPESQTALMLKDLRAKRGKLYLDTAQREVELGHEEVTRIIKEFVSILQGSGR